MNQQRTYAEDNSANDYKNDIPNLLQEENSTTSQNEETNQNQEHQFLNQTPILLNQPNSSNNSTMSPFSQTAPVDTTDMSHDTSFISTTSTNRTGIKPLVKKKKRRRKRLSNKDKKFHLAKVTAAIQNQPIQEKDLTRKNIMVRINPVFRNQSVNNIPQLPFSMKSSYIEEIANCSEYDTVGKHSQVFKNIYQEFKGNLEKVKQSVKSLKSEKSLKKEQVYQGQNIQPFVDEKNQSLKHSSYSNKSKKMKNYHSSNSHTTLQSAYQSEIDPPSHIEPKLNLNSLENASNGPKMFKKLDIGETVLDMRVKEPSILVSSNRQEYEKQELPQKNKNRQPLEIIPNEANNENNDIKESHKPPKKRSDSKKRRKRERVKVKVFIEEENITKDNNNQDFENLNLVLKNKETIEIETQKNENLRSSSDSRQKLIFKTLGENETSESLNQNKSKVGDQIPYEKVNISENGLGFMASDSLKMPENIQTQLNSIIVPNSNQQCGFYKLQQNNKGGVFHTNSKNGGGKTNYEDQIPETLCKELRKSQKLEVQDFTAPQSNIPSERSINKNLQRGRNHADSSSKYDGRCRKVVPNSASKRIFDEEDSENEDSDQPCEELNYLYKDDLDDFHRNHKPKEKQKDKLPVSDLLQQQTGTFESLQNQETEQRSPDLAQDHVTPTQRVEQLKNKLGYLLSKLDQSELHDDPISQRQTMEMHQMSKQLQNGNNLTPRDLDSLERKIQKYEVLRQDFNNLQKKNFQMFENRKQSNSSAGSEFTFHNGLGSNNHSNYKSLNSEPSERQDKLQGPKTSNTLLIDKDMLTRLIQQNGNSQHISLDQLQSILMVSQATGENQMGKVQKIRSSAHEKTISNDSLSYKYSSVAQQVESFTCSNTNQEDLFKKRGSGNAFSIPNTSMVSSQETEKQSIAGISSKFNSLQRRNEEDLRYKKQYCSQVAGKIAAKEEEHQFNPKMHKLPYIIPSSEEDRLENEHSSANKFNLKYPSNQISEVTEEHTDEDDADTSFVTISKALTHNDSLKQSDFISNCDKHFENKEYSMKSSVYSDQFKTLHNYSQKLANRNPEYLEDLKEQLDYLTPDSKIESDQKHPLNRANLLNYESVISQNIDHLDFESLKSFKELKSNLKKQLEQVRSTGKVSLEDLQNIYCYTISVQNQQSDFKKNKADAFQNKSEVKSKNPNHQGLHENDPQLEMQNAFNLLVTKKGKIIPNPEELNQSTLDKIDLTSRRAYHSPETVNSNIQPLTDQTQTHINRNRNSTSPRSRKFQRMRHIQKQQQIQKKICNIKVNPEKAKLYLNNQLSSIQSSLKNSNVFILNSNNSSLKPLNSDFTQFTNSQIEALGDSIPYPYLLENFDFDKEKNQFNLKSGYDKKSVLKSLHSLSQSLKNSAQFTHSPNEDSKKSSKLNSTKYDRRSRRMTLDFNIESIKEENSDVFSIEEEKNGKVSKRNNSKTCSEKNQSGPRRNPEFEKKNSEKTQAIQDYAIRKPSIISQEMNKEDDQFSSLKSSKQFDTTDLRYIRQTLDQLETKSNSRANSLSNSNIHDSNIQENSNSNTTNEIKAVIELHKISRRMNKEQLPGMVMGINQHRKQSHSHHFTSEENSMNLNFQSNGTNNSPKFKYDKAKKIDKLKTKSLDQGCLLNNQLIVLNKSSYLNGSQNEEVNRLNDAGKSNGQHSSNLQSISELTKDNMGLEKSKNSIFKTTKNQSEACDESELSILKSHQSGGGIMFTIPFDDSKSKSQKGGYTSLKSDKKLKRLAQRSQSRSRSIKERRERIQRELELRKVQLDEEEEPLSFKFKTKKRETIHHRELNDTLAGNTFQTKKDYRQHHSVHHEWTPGNIKSFNQQYDEYETKQARHSRYKYPSHKKKRASRYKDYRECYVSDTSESHDFEDDELDHSQENRKRRVSKEEMQRRRENFRSKSKSFSEKLRLKNKQKRMKHVKGINGRKRVLRERKSTKNIRNQKSHSGFYDYENDVEDYCNDDDLACNSFQNIIDYAQNENPQRNPYHHRSINFENLKKDGFYEDPLQDYETMKEEYEDFIIDRYSIDYSSASCNHSRNNHGQNVRNDRELYQGNNRNQQYYNQNRQNQSEGYHNIEMDDYETRFRGFRNRVNRDLRHLEELELQNEPNQMRARTRIHQSHHHPHNIDRLRAQNRLGRSMGYENFEKLRNGRAQGHFDTLEPRGRQEQAIDDFERYNTQNLQKIYHDLSNLRQKLDQDFETENENLDYLTKGIRNKSKINPISRKEQSYNRRKLLNSNQFRSVTPPTRNQKYFNERSGHQLNIEDRRTNKKVNLGDTLKSRFSADKHSKKSTLKKQRPKNMRRIVSEQQFAGQKKKLFEDFEEKQRKKAQRMRQKFNRFQQSEKENYSRNQSSFKNSSLEKRIRALERNNLIKEYDQKIRNALRNNRL